jgi:hypothetical protein
LRAPLPEPIVSPGVAGVKQEEALRDQIHLNWREDAVSALRFLGGENQIVFAEGRMGMHLFAFPFKIFT